MSRRADPGMLVLVLAVTISACARPSTEGDARAAGPIGQPVPAAVRVPLEVYLQQAVLVAGLERAAAVILLGHPDSVVSVPTPNRHAPQVTDSIVTLHYAGGLYVFYVVTQAGRDLLEHAIIRSNEHLRYAAPGIGTPVDSVRAWLGEPLLESDGALEYDCLACEVPAPVTFDIENGSVRRILFAFYVD